MARTKARRKLKPPAQIGYFFGVIERSALSYGINHYHHKRDEPRPYSRSLKLFGRMEYPETMRGATLEVWLIGKNSLIDRLMLPQDHDDLLFVEPLPLSQQFASTRPECRTHAARDAANDSDTCSRGA